MLNLARILLVAILGESLLWDVGSSTRIQILECRPPDYPLLGGYGPMKGSYLPGDRIHYFCETQTYIGGNFLRICLDNGDWTGDTPVCDAAASFDEVTQSSTNEPEPRNAASRATDGLRDTCSKTSSLAQEEPTWTGFLKTQGTALRVMLFLPKGFLAYEVRIIRSDGSEQSCGIGQRNIVAYEWTFHNCPEPNNTGAVAVKIVSRNSRPLELCEVIIHTLTDPTCVDPHFPIDNGRLAISRKEARLVCDKGYSEGQAKKLECVRTGVWNRKALYCEETKWVEKVNVGTNQVEDREQERFSKGKGANPL